MRCMSDDEYAVHRLLVPIAKLAIVAVKSVDVARECDQATKTARVFDICQTEKALTAAVNGLPAALVETVMKESVDQSRAAVETVSP